jgi:phosphatidylserine/phosphatidylglycerophosphate/cardiolipin synthase-like enzyme
MPGSDGAGPSELITGSFNFTKAAEGKNAENLLIIKSRELAPNSIWITGISTGSIQRLTNQSRY